MRRVEGTNGGRESCWKDGAGTNASPVINVQTTMHDVRYGGINVERVTGSAVYENLRAKVAVDLARGGRPALLARGSLPVELRYFGGLTIEETAEFLKRSPASIKRDWNLARAWLFQEMSKSD